MLNDRKRNNACFQFKFQGVGFTSWFVKRLFFILVKHVTPLAIWVTMSC